MIRAGIIGGTGYVGAELVRLLLSHPQVEISGISSSSYKGMEFSQVYPGFNSCINMQCKDGEEIIRDSDIVFAALPHGMSEEIAKACYDAGVIFIDMGADFRLDNEEDYNNWYKCEYKIKELHTISQYGLPELYRDKIKESKIIGNPGCYPTSIMLGIAPLLIYKYIDPKFIVIDSKSGVTGAGRGLDLSTHFPECNESIKAYKVGSHRHTPEIEQEMTRLFGEKISISFTPHLIPMNRGMISTIYCNIADDKTGEELHELYKGFYSDEKFVRILDKGINPESRYVRYSNYCDIGINYDSRVNRVVIVSAIDNMMKGAAGQAVQNMNIIFGLKEDMGLDMVPISL